MPVRHSRGTGGSRRSEGQDQFWVRSRARMESAARTGGMYRLAHSLLELDRLTHETGQLVEKLAFGSSKTKLFAK